MDPVRLLGTICLLCMFFVSGVHKTMHRASTVESLISKVPQWPLPTLSVLVVILVELLCPLIIVYSTVSEEMVEYSTYSKYVLIGFTILVTLIYHPLRFDQPYMRNVPFFSNLSLVGGLLTIL